MKARDFTIVILVVLVCVMLMTKCVSSPTFEQKASDHSIDPFTAD